MPKPLILLHGALSSKNQFDGLLPLLQTETKMALDFPGHGFFALEREDDFTLEGFARSVISVMDQQDIQQADVLGYSMGGYVAIYLCINYPERFNKIITLATKYQWSPEVAASETGKLSPQVLLEKAPAFVEQLKKLHPATPWETLLERTASFMHQLGRNDYLAVQHLSAVPHQVLVSIGDRDKMVTLDETVKAYKAFPHGQLAVLPDTPHPLERMNLHRLAQLVNPFLAD